MSNKIFSYSWPPKPVEAASINWNELPEVVQPKFFESEKVRKTASTVLGSLSAPTAGASLYAAICLTVSASSALTFVLTTGGLGFLSLALASSAIAISRLEPSANDPEQRLKLRQEAGKDLMAHPEYSLETIQNKYKKEIISDKDINILLARDIQTLPYPQLIKKHGRRLLDFVNAANWEHLRNNFVNYYINEYSWNELKAMPEFSLFKITPEEAGEAIATKEAYRLMQKGGTYAEYIERNSSLAINWVVDARAKEYLEVKLQEHLFLEKKGLIYFEHQSGPLLRNLQEKRYLNLKQDIIRQELEAFLRGELDYLSLRERNGCDLIITSSYQNSDLREKLRKAFLELPYEHLNNPSFERERNALNVLPQDIKEGLKKQWIQTPLIKLLSQPVFYQSLQREFSPRDWTEKALKETENMTVRDIAAQMPGLFNFGILKADDALKGQSSIKQRLEREFATCYNLESILISFDEVLFKHHLFDVKRLSPFVTDYIFRNANHFVRGTNRSQDDANVKKFIETYGLLPDRITETLGKARTSFASETYRFEDALKAIEKNYQTQLLPLSQERSAAVMQAHNVFDIDTKRRLAHTLKESLDKVNNAQANLQRSLRDLSNQERSLTVLIEEKESALQARRFSYSFTLLQRQNTFNLEHDLRTSQTLLKRAEEQLLNDPEISRCSRDISLLKEKKVYLERQVATWQRNVSTAEQKYRAFSALITEQNSLKRELESPIYAQEIQMLQQRLAHDEAAAKKQVTGLAEALSALRNARSQSEINKDKNRLADLLSKPNKLLVISQKILETGSIDPHSTAQTLEEFKRQLSQCRSDLLKEEKHLPELKIRVEDRLGLPRLKLEITRLKHTLEKAREKDQEARSLEFEIDKLSKELAQLKTQLQGTSQSLYFNRIKERENQQQIQSLTRNYNDASAIYDNSDKLLKKTIGDCESAFDRKKQSLDIIKVERLTEATSLHQIQVSRIENEFLLSLKENKDSGGFKISFVW